MARGELAERRGWLIRLEGDEGAGDARGRDHAPVGLATAMPIEGFGGEDFDACGEALGRALAAGPSAPASMRHAPFAASALALARLDLEARRKRLTLAKSLAAPGHAPATSVAVNALVGGGEADALRARVRSLRAYDVIKLKLGANVGDALRCIEAASSELASGQRLRVDPNQAWSEADAERALRALAGRPIDFVEQPVASVQALARLRRASPVELAADESACDAEALDEVMAAGAADVIVLKPMRAGGPSEALRLARKAHAAGLGVVVTSLLDSAIGVRAALAVALAFESPLRPCGLETAGLFAADLAAGPERRAGRVHGWSGPGLGIEIDEAALDALALAPERTWPR